MAEVADLDSMLALRGATYAQRGQFHDPEADKTIFREFYVNEDLDPVASEREGRPIYKSVDYIRYGHPADKFNQMDRPVEWDPQRRSSDFYRFPEYKAWKEGKAVEATGTPLRILADIQVMTRADVKGFEHMGIRTAEQFVAVSDSDGQRIPAFQQLKVAVQAYLAKSKDAAPALAMQRELKERDAKLHEQTAKLEEQSVQLAQQQEAIKSMADTVAELKRAQKSKQ